MNDDMSFFTDGAAYDRMMGRWSQIAGEAFLDWLAMPTGLRWLDVGCGNGAFSEVLMAKCPPSALHGIDPSDAQLEHARKRLGAGNVQFETAAAQALPIEDASFDAATMALVISFIPDPAKAVAEMARVVNPGGCVASYMWDGPGGGLPYQAITAAAEEIGIAPRFRPPGKAHSFSELQDLWRRAGLEKIETRRIDVPAVFSDFDDFWDSSILLATPTRKVIDDLTPDNRERLRAHLRDTLPTDANGRVSVAAFVNAVKGQASDQVS